MYEKVGANVLSDILFLTFLDDIWNNWAISRELSPDGLLSTYFWTLWRCWKCVCAKNYSDNLAAVSIQSVDYICCVESEAAAAS